MNYIQQVKILTGQDALTTYVDNKTDSGSGLSRIFCSTCGSGLFLTSDSNPVFRDLFIVATGTLDFPRDEWAPQLELYTHKRMGWIPHLEYTKDV